MKKKAQVSLKKNNDIIKKEVEITIKNNKINYSVNKADVMFLPKEELLIRDNNKIYLEYDFNKSTGLIYVKELKSNLYIELKVIKKIVKDNFIEIEYEIEDDKYIYTIKME